MQMLETFRVEFIYKVPCYCYLLVWMVLLNLIKIHWKSSENKLLVISLSLNQVFIKT